jgi:uncharacterized protein
VVLWLHARRGTDRLVSIAEELKADLDAIGCTVQRNGEKLDELTEEEYKASIESIQPAALRLYNYWVANPQQPEAKKASC